MKQMIAKIPQSLRQMAIYGTGLVLTKVISLLMVPVFTNFLSPADYGRLDILQTLANLLSIVIAFGLSQSLFRFAGEAQEAEAKRRTAAEIFGFALILGAVSLTLTQLFAPEIQSMLPGAVTEIQVRLILGSLALSGAILVPMAWLRMRDKAVSYFAASAGCAVAQAALTAVLLYLGFGLEGALMAGLICMTVTALMVCLIQFRDTGAALPRRTYGRYGHFGGVLVFTGMAAFVIDSFPRWILAGVAGPAELAMFALAAKIALIAGFLTHPFEMWWMPRRFAVLTKTNGLEKSARAVERGIVMALAAAIAVGAAGPLVVTVMTPAAYHGAVAFVPVLALLMATNAIVRLVNVGCLSQEKGVWPLIIDGAAAGAACLGYFLSIPHWGGWGIVAVTGVILVLRVAAYLIIGRRFQDIPYAYGRLAPLAVICVSASVAMTVNPTVWASFAIGAVAFAALIIGAAMADILPITTLIKKGARKHVAA